MQTVKSKKGLFKLKQERETESEEKIILYFKPGDFSKPLRGGEIEAEIQMIWRNDFTKICPDSGAKALNWELDMRQNLSAKIWLVELAGIWGHFFKDKIQALERHTESFMVRASRAFLSLVVPAPHPIPANLESKRPGVIFTSKLLPSCQVVFMYIHTGEQISVLV